MVVFPRPKVIVLYVWGDAMKMFDEQSSWPSCRADILKTDASLEAAGEVHAKLRQVIVGLLSNFDALQAKSQKADDAMTRANARVAFADDNLDDTSEDFAAQLSVDSRDHRNREPFQHFFPSAPNETIRMGLDNQLKATARWETVAKSVTLSTEAQRHYASVQAARKAGDEALQGRIDAAHGQTAVALEFLSWKEDANAARRSVWNHLDRYATEQGLPRDYADRFFLRGERRGAGRKGPKGGAKPEGEEG